MTLLDSIYRDVPAIVNGQMVTVVVAMQWPGDHTIGKGSIVYVGDNLRVDGNSVTILGRPAKTILKAWSTDTEMFGNGTRRVSWLIDGAFPFTKEEFEHFLNVPDTRPSKPNGTISINVKFDAEKFKQATNDAIRACISFE